MEFSLHNALAHLKSKDERLGDLIDFFEIRLPNKADANFNSLVRIIVSQQLSGKAADTIFKNLSTLLNVGEIKLEDILNASPKKLRCAGISNSKCSFIISLAEFISDNPEFFDELDPGDATSTIDKLTGLKGVGPWSASIFAMSCLEMQNILPRNDTTLLKAIKKLYGYEVITEHNLDHLFQIWTPYNSIASRVLWTWADTDFTSVKN